MLMPLMIDRGISNIKLENETILLPRTFPHPTCNFDHQASNIFSYSENIVVLNFFSKKDIAKKQSVTNSLCLFKA